VRLSEVAGHWRLNSVTGLVNVGTPIGENLQAPDLFGIRKKRKERSKEKK
jgi:hypothetical protein